MTDYTKTTNFTAKDSLPSGNPDKVIKGSLFDTEFDNLATAVASKADKVSPTFTGTATLPTTQIQDTSADHQYIIGVSELTADRTVTLPLLTGNDTFVFEAHTATLTNKTVNLSSNTLTGTKAQFDTACSDGSFAFSGGAFHDGFSDYVANEHIDWTSTTENFSTSGTLGAGAATVTSLDAGSGLIQTTGNLQAAQGTFTGDLLLNMGSQNYTVTGRGATALAIQSQSSATSADVDFFTADGDGDNNFINVWGYGIPSNITNRERLKVGYSSGNAQYEINTSASGTGTLRPLVLYTGSNTDQLKLNTDGNNSMSGSLTVSGQILGKDGTAGSPSYSFSNDGDTGMYLSTPGRLFFTAGGTDYLGLLNTVFSLRDNITLGFGDNASLRLERDADDILAQRRSANAQEFRLYNTYTDASNYERLALDWDTNVLQINTESAGTGSDRQLRLAAGSGNIGQLDLNTDGSVSMSGVLSAATIEPTGDTAAGDNAAIGYTASEGLILTGQGSSNDVTIKNDADATALYVPTGTTSVNIADDLTVGTNLTINGPNLNVPDGSLTVDRDDTSSPPAAQISKGNAAASGSVIDVLLTGSSPDDNTVTFAEFKDSTTTRLFIYSDGDLANHDGTYGTISDVSLKEDFQEARSYWDDFKSLSYQSYLMKTDIEQYGEKAERRLGLVAQEVEKIFPKLVKGEEGDKFVKSSIIDGVINSIVLQEAMERIEELEKTIERLTNKR